MGTPAEKLLRLKRSLTFMRSKSVENFFQRSQSDAYPPTELFPSALPPSPRLFPGPAHGNGSAVLPSPSISSRPAPLGVQPRPVQTHFFLEHVFRRPTSCSLCKLIIAGNSKQGLRCKTCKMGAHLWCVSEASEKPCQGKSSKLHYTGAKTREGRRNTTAVMQSQPNMPSFTHLRDSGTPGTPSGATGQDGRSGMSVLGPHPDAQGGPQAAQELDGPPGPGSGCGDSICPGPATTRASKQYGSSG
ncbi:SH3 and cysteine-rich domain-containing 2-like protein [Labeo rohita]|uniref:SH3 and cysteine-rich domain-containing 2-like protein n=1 Tax=Labeo rohita TaxID=84645 RepID=A0A498M9F5_LABRO|nr:SH3 and cysteine-rich domain-containing 2-like protein [Labeo rohita]